MTPMTTCVLCSWVFTLTMLPGVLPPGVSEHDIPIVGPFYLRTAIPELFNDSGAFLARECTLSSQKGLSSPLDKALTGMLDCMKVEQTWLERVIRATRMSPEPE